MVFVLKLRAAFIVFPIANLINFPANPAICGANLFTNSSAAYLQRYFIGAYAAPRGVKRETVSIVHANNERDIENRPNGSIFITGLFHLFCKVRFSSNTNSLRIVMTSPGPSHVSHDPSGVLKEKWENVSFSNGCWHFGHWI